MWWCLTGRFNKSEKMPDHLGEDMRKVKNEEEKEEKEIKCEFRFVTLFIVFFHHDSYFLKIFSTG